MIHSDSYLIYVYLQCKHFENDHQDVDMDSIEPSKEDDGDVDMEDNNAVDVDMEQNDDVDVRRYFEIHFL